LSDGGDIGAILDPGASAISRGVRRALVDRGFATLREFPLPNGRRADLLGVDEAGTVLIVEIKSGVADFRSDRKWPEYRDWCDLFAFAVDEDFPTELIPDACGLLIADAHGAAEVRPSPAIKLAGARRGAIIRRFAVVAARRLHRLEDPTFSSAEASL